MVALSVPPGATGFPQGWFTQAANNLIGPTVASVAGVITLPYRFQSVSGALAVTGIALSFWNGTAVVSAPDFCGYITVFPLAAFTWTAATNIILAGTAVIGKSLDFFYNPVSAKWYPSYIA